MLAYEKRAAARAEAAAAYKARQEAETGLAFKKAIASLYGDFKKNGLKALPARGAITAKRKVAKRTGSGDAGDRQEISRTYFTTVRELRSSDGLFLLQYTNVASVTFAGGTDRYLDFDPDA